MQRMSFTPSAGDCLMAIPLRYFTSKKTVNLAQQRFFLIIPQESQLIASMQTK